LLTWRQTLKFAHVIFYLLAMKSIIDFLTERARSVIAVGICFLVIGVLFKSAFFTLYQFSWVSAVGLVLGTVMTGMGFLALVQFYLVNDIYGKIGSILATSSFLCFSVILVAITYTVIDSYKVIVHRFRGTIYFAAPTEVIPILTRPFGWLVFPMFLAGICLLVAGIILRAHSEDMLA